MGRDWGALVVCESHVAFFSSRRDVSRFFAPDNTASGFVGKRFDQNIESFTYDPNGVLHFNAKLSLKPTNPGLEAVALGPCCLFTAQRVTRFAAEGQDIQQQTDRLLLGASPIISLRSELAIQGRAFDGATPMARRRLW